MQRDFGECLVEVRERLEQPLPLRVRQGRVFFGGFCENFVGALLRLRHYQSIITQHQGLVAPEADFDEVITVFKLLDGRRASPEQMEQAHRAFEEQMQRRNERMRVEVRLWFQALQAGSFLGALAFGLINLSIVLSSVTDHPKAGILLVIAFVLTQSVGMLICLRGWHRP